jgi:predicted nuclease of predicted toxin-antitoxin system
LRILLDENLDWRLARDLTGHDVSSVPRIGWAGITNGDLLNRAQKQFDVIVTMDVGLVQQQNITEYSVMVVVLRARSNRLTDTQPLMPMVLEELENVRPGTIVSVPE